MSLSLKTKQKYSTPDVSKIKDENVRTFGAELSRVLFQAFRDVYDDLKALAIRPAFSVHKNGTDQSVAGSDTKVTWSTEAYDTHGVFASSKFTTTIPGKYLLTASLRYKTITDQTYMQVKIFKNGSAIKSRLIRGSGTSSHSVQIAVIVDAARGDYFEVYSNHGSGTNKDIDGDAERTFFQGIMQSN